MEVADRALLRATVGTAIERAAASSDARAVDAVLDDLGWLEMLDAEPREAIGIVFSALGETNATATALDDVMASALGVTPRADLAVLLPSFASWDPPGRAGGGTFRGTGLGTARVVTATEIIVVSAADGGAVGHVVPITAAETRAVRGVDPDLGLHVVVVDHDGAAAVPGAGAAWASAVALGRRAVAHQIAGGCRAMLSLACAHAVERVQFGRPIARFQAVRHRLADALVALEALDAALAAAADEPGPQTAALAKALAGRTARTVAAQCQQVLAGVGFTTDHPFHRSMKRTMMLDGLFGLADDITLDLGRALLASRTVPTLIEL